MNLSLDLSHKAASPLRSPPVHVGSTSSQPYSSPPTSEARLTPKPVTISEFGHAVALYVKNNASQGSANGSASEGPEAPRFGQLAGRSVLTPPLVIPHFRTVFENIARTSGQTPSLHPSTDPLEPE